MFLNIISDSLLLINKCYTSLYSYVGSNWWLWVDSLWFYPLMAHGLSASLMHHLWVLLVHLHSAYGFAAHRMRFYLPRKIRLGLYLGDQPFQFARDCPSGKIKSLKSWETLQSQANEDVWSHYLYPPFSVCSICPPLTAFMYWKSTTAEFFYSY